jgi:hypothetical protein
VSDEPFEVVDPSVLEDGDRAELDRMQQVYREGGKKALDKAMGKLAKDEPARFLRIMAAVFP